MILNVAATERQPLIHPPPSHAGNMLEVDEAQKAFKKQEKLGLLDDNTYIEDEQAPQQPWHTRILRGMVTGVGFLSDAYDLYVLSPFFPLFPSFPILKKNYFGEVKGERCTKSCKIAFIVFHCNSENSRVKITQKK